MHNRSKCCTIHLVYTLCQKCEHVAMQSYADLLNPFILMDLSWSNSALDCMIGLIKYLFNLGRLKDTLQNCLLCQILKKKTEKARIIESCSHICSSACLLMCKLFWFFLESTFLCKVSVLESDCVFPSATHSFSNAPSICCCWANVFNGQNTEKPFSLSWTL